MTWQRRVRRQGSSSAGMVVRCACLVAFLVVGTAADALAQRVRRVIDGDTITVSGVGVVRLIGVDAPEKTGGYLRPERFGDEATRFMTRLVEGHVVRLEYDSERKDKYDRTLAYVFLEDGTLVNEAIIRAGWAETYRRFKYTRKPAFQAAEREARAAHRGMWQRRQTQAGDPSQAATMSQTGRGGTFSAPTPQ